MLPLADAAYSRSEADWLVGINGTRAMTAFNSKLGGFFKTTVGRVQTPTLAIVVEREAKIRKFVSRDFWEVIGTFDAAAGQYTGRWFDEKFSKADDKDGDDQLKPERIWDVGQCASHSGQMPRQAGHRHRGKQAEHVAVAVALRFDQFAARRELAVWFFARRTRWGWRRRFTNGTRC